MRFERVFHRFRLRVAICISFLPENDRATTCAKAPGVTDWCTLTQEYWQIPRPSNTWWCQSTRKRLFEIVPRVDSSSSLENPNPRTVAGRNVHGGTGNAERAEGRSRIHGSDRGTLHHLGLPPWTKLRSKKATSEEQEHTTTLCKSAPTLKCLRQRFWLIITHNNQFLNPSQFIVHAYQKLLKKYKTLVRSAKRESWQKFTEFTESTSELARLVKIIRYHPKYSIGLLRRSDGRMTDSQEQTLELLTNTSFPGSKAWEADNAPPQRKPFALKTPEKWMTIDMIKSAFNDLGPMKAAGPDEIRPILLQHAPLKFLKNLQNIYCSSIQSGYSQARWRDSKVIYIPKVGKDAYDVAKSCRPITLTSHIFKGLEKLVYWHFEATTLKTKPYHANQHALQPGKSIERTKRDSERN